jgi:hypothetical protein
VDAAAIRAQLAAAKVTAAALPPGPAVFRFLDRFRGEHGGLVFKGAWAMKLMETSTPFRTANSYLFLAPAWKWGLAIAPLYGIYLGVPAVENLDLNQSLALTFTGIVWAYYSMLIRPIGYLLFAVNIALLAVNGYNVYRRINYDRQQTEDAAAATADMTSDVKQ